MGSLIKVSIIMPVYNTGKLLKQTIECILAQVYENWELILVDDGSNDDISLTICSEFASKDERIRVYHKNNGGICDARNLGLSKATGDYIAFCDHDDEYNPSLLLKVVQAAEECGADIIKYRYESINDDGTVYLLPLLDSGKFYTNDVNSILVKLISLNYLSTIWSCVYKREIVINSGEMFDTRYRHGGEDFDYNIRIFKYINKYAVLPDILYTHYIRESLSTSSKVYSDVYENMCKKLIQTNNLINERGIDVRKLDDNYLKILIDNVRFIVSYGIKLKLHYDDIREQLERLYASNLLKMKCNIDNFPDRFVYYLFSKRMFRCLYVLCKYR